MTCSPHSECDNQDIGWPPRAAVAGVAGRTGGSERVDERVLAHRLGIAPRGCTDTQQFSRGDGDSQRPGKCVSLQATP
jgi:hypothetical protein